MTFSSAHPIIRAMELLLLEIGTEEIPPSFLDPAANELERRIRALLTEHEIKAGEAEVFYTPRRLAVHFAEVAAERPARTIELQGPPRKAAFDKDGKPTRTGIGFARAHGNAPEDLGWKKTDKGEYAFIEKQLPSVNTADVLREKLPGIVASIPFPKTMRWRSDKTRFARPIRWLLCMFGTESVRFEFAGLTAGNKTHGHRGFGDKPIEITTPGDYEKLLLDHKVVASPKARRQSIMKEIAEMATGVNAIPVEDPELVEETVNTTEFPVPILCDLQPEHLTLPPEVLITALKKHQRCFAVHKENHKLLPYFIAVADAPNCDKKTVANWYEHAVGSRLRDAQFFFDADMKKGLEPLVKEEKRVTWIKGIGSYSDKTEHLRGLCQHLAKQVPDADAETLDRAAYLAKADLLTQMIREKEFTSLQGKMGGIYARLQGEPAPVADAIAEQYLPATAEDELPRTLEACLLSIADKTDNIIATFLTGAIPTGSEDPFALRRQATGILAAILDRKLPTDIDRLIDAALNLFPTPNPYHAGRIRPFIKERLQIQLGEKGIPYDIVGAVIETTWHLPCQALASAKALLEFREQAEFERLIIGQKRVANILRGQDISGLPDPGLLCEPAEKELWKQAQEIEPQLDKAVKAQAFTRAIELLLSLRSAIDRLFDDVLVMAEDEKLRTNRLQLLGYVRSLFRKVADLSKVVIVGISTQRAQSHGSAPSQVPSDGSTLEPLNP